MNSNEFAIAAALGALLIGTLARRLLAARPLRVSVSKVKGIGR